MPPVSRARTDTHPSRSSNKSGDVSLRPEDIAELFKPSRLEIYESLQLAGPASIAELAERLGRAADSLYYHVRKLVGIGLVESRSSEGEGAPGRNGTIYGVAAKTVTMKLDLQSPRSLEAWAGGVAALLRLADRDVRATLDSGAARTEGPLRNLAVRRVKARLTDRELKQVNAHVDRISALFRSRAGRSRGNIYALTTVLTPLEERTR